MINTIIIYLIGFVVNFYLLKLFFHFFEVNRTRNDWAYVKVRAIISLGSWISVGTLLIISVILFLFLLIIKLDEWFSSKYKNRYEKFKTKPPKWL